MAQIPTVWTKIQSLLVIDPNIYNNEKNDHKKILGLALIPFINNDRKYNATVVQQTINIDKESNINVKDDINKESNINDSIIKIELCH